jgi:4-amino-4-deoxy-L-arabinose transferase-like glycosyltransferase
MQTPHHSRNLAALTIAAVLASFFLCLGTAPLFDVDEGAFSQATMEMFQRGDFLSTYLNGVPRYDKPILVYWLQAACVVLLGPTEWAFRLPSAICATLWCWLIFLFARAQCNITVGLAAAACAATSLGVFIIGRAATADSLLNLLIAAAMFSAWLYLQRGERKWLYGTFATIGLGVLAKGPVAILVPGAVTLLFCLLRRDVKTWLRMVFDWRGIVLFIAIAAPWYVVILQKEGWAFVEGFIMKHNVQRFSQPLQSHGGSLVYYFPVVLMAFLPHTGLFLRIFLKIKELWRDDLQCFLLLWFAFVFVFFSLSGTKLPHYVLYGMSGMFVLIGLQATQSPSRWWLAVPVVLLFAFLLALPWALDAAAARTSDAYYREALGLIRVRAAYYLYIGLAALFLLWLVLERRIEAAHKLAAAGALAVASLAALVVPMLGAVQQPVKDVARGAHARGWDVVMWGINAPSFSVYYGKAVAIRTPRPGDFVITRARRLNELPPHETFYSRGGVALVRIGG